MAIHAEESCVFKPSKVGRIKELTEELSEDQRELGLFFDLCPDMLCIASSDGYFVKLNQAWQRELGWSIQELTQSPFLDFIHPDDVEPTKKIMEKMQTCQVVRFHNRYKVKGTDKYVVLEWNATNWSDGYTYAVAREVPSQCLQCPDSEERFKWVHRSGN